MYFLCIRPQIKHVCLSVCLHEGQVRLIFDQNLDHFLQHSLAAELEIILNEMKAIYVKRSAYVFISKIIDSQEYFSSLECFSESKPLMS